jgi:hypothetical protein
MAGGEAVSVGADSNASPPDILSTPSPVLTDRADQGDGHVVDGYSSPSTRTKRSDRYRSTSDSRIR